MKITYAEDEDRGYQGYDDCWCHEDCECGSNPDLQPPTPDSDPVQEMIQKLLNEGNRS